MRWFQHQTDSHDNLKLQRLKKVFGMEGLGFWWLCCELVGQQGTDYLITKEKCWKDWLEIQSCFPQEKIDAVLEKMSEFGLIGQKEYERGDLFIQQMQDYSDDYSKRVRRVFGDGSVSVRQDKIRIDKNRGDNIYTEDFENFWNFYPKRVGKGDAYRSWNKINPNKELQEKIKTAIERQKLSRQWKEENGQYIPNPSTWLNQGRWDDELKEARPNVFKV